MGTAVQHDDGVVVGSVRLATGSIETSGGWMHYYDSGSGYPVVFLHGSGPGASSLSNFRQNIPALAARHRVLLPDMLGYGRSEKRFDGEFDADSLTTALAEMLDRLEIERCAVVGNSLGGGVAMKLALLRPNMVERLILLAPAGLGEREVYSVMPGIQGIMQNGLRDGGPTAESLRDLLRLQVVDFGLVNDNIINERLSVARTQPKRVYETLRVSPVTDRLHEIRCPVLIFWGTKDNFCPLHTSLTLIERLTDAKLIVSSDCGHWVQLERASMFDAEVASFLGPVTGSYVQ